MLRSQRTYQVVPGLQAGYELPAAWSVILPESTTNLITNPSFETNTTGYSATGGSIARSTAEQRYGAYSLAHTPAAGTNAVINTTGFSTTAGQPYVFSVSVKAQAGTPLRIGFYTTGNVLLGVGRTFYATGFWQRFSVRYDETSSTTRRVGIALNNSTNLPVVYTDGWQVENKAYDTTYCDGDQIGFNTNDYAWTGTAHASTSTRSARCRAGGKIMNFRRLGVVMLAIAGLSMLSFDTQGQQYALIGGGEYERSVEQIRDFSMGIRWDSDSQIGLMQRVAAFLDAVSPNRVAPQQPVILRYQELDERTGAAISEEVEIQAVYTGGLESDSSNLFQRQSTARFRSFMPYIRGANDAAALDWQDTISINRVISTNQNTGVWSTLGGGTVSGIVYGWGLGTDGSVYAGGSFTTIGGVAANRIARWTGTTWTGLSTGANGEVRSIATGPDGALYVGGLFTLMGGIANTAYIAKWDGSAWTALSTGANGNIYAVAVAPDGSVYAGGDFTTIGGVAANRIARWNGSAWSALGTGANGTVTDIAIGADGTVYAGGSFTLMGGIASTAYIAKWNGTAWTALGTGGNAGVNALIIGPDGAVYAGGSFTLMGGVTNTAYIAKWNGTGWYPLGTGMGASVSSLSFDASGLLYAGGTFTSAGGLSFTDGFAIWNGSTWVPVSVDLPGGFTVDTILHTPSEMFAGTRISGSTATNGNTTVDNQGALAYPQIKMIGPGRVISVRNITTGKTIYFNLVLNSGETAILTLGPNVSFVSTFRGDILNTILAGSSLTDFALIPGDNLISAFITGTTDANTTMIMLWMTQYESLEQSVYR